MKISENWWMGLKNKRTGSIIINKGNITLLNESNSCLHKNQCFRTFSCVCNFLSFFETKANFVGWCLWFLEPWPTKAQWILCTKAMLERYVPFDHRSESIIVFICIWFIAKAVVTYHFVNTFLVFGATFICNFNL